ncbi:unnamed protein product [Owenia fusiformis]|uniref:Uncharacterized protein n=1 Tax=Owenia fusiformis TaxID=6347 RepID=A0A8J1TI01_OWEFU|nr:unnamed protein product [Owenia fusiformis]
MIFYKIEINIRDPDGHFAGRMAPRTFTPMEDVFLKNDYGAIKEYITQLNDYEQVCGVYINLPGQHKNNETLVPHWLAFQGYTDLVRKLFDTFQEHKIKDLQDKRGCVPLHYAIWNGDHQTINYLIATGGIHCYDNEGLGVLHYCCFRKNNRTQTANNLLKYDNSILKHSDNNGSSALHNAVIEGKIDLVQFFITVWGADINLTNSQLDTPLHLAAYWQHHNIVQYLLDLKAITDMKNNDEKTILHMHLSVHEDTCQESTDCLQLLLENNPSNILTKDNNCDTSIHLASQDGNSNALKIMLQNPEIKEADLNIENRDPYTPLQLAVKSQSFETVQCLLGHPGVDINYKNSQYQETALHYASRENNTEITKALIDAGADINVQAFGRTPLHAATLLHKKDMVALLLENEADPMVEDWNGLAAEELATPRVKPIFRKTSLTPSSASSQRSSSSSTQNFTRYSCDGYIDERTIKEILEDIQQRLTVVETKDSDVQIPDDILAVMLDIKERQKVVREQLKETTRIKPGSARLDIHEAVNKLTDRVAQLEAIIKHPIVGLGWTPLQTGPLRDDNIKKIAGQMGRNWKRVARNLNVQNPELDQIEASYPYNNPRQIFVAFCIHWGVS